MKKRDINSSRIPVYRDAGFELFDADTASGAFNSETSNEREPELYIYSRYRNPTVVAAEEEILKIEGARWALLTQSGMSAIDVALSIFQKGREVRPWLFFSEIYGGTITYADFILKQKRGLDIHSFSPDGEKYDINKFEALMKKIRPEIVYFEAISNPMLIVPDVKNIIEISKKYEAIIFVDNTFATPLLWKPLNDGADIVIHSATKYLSGHGNITAGVICGNDDDILRKCVEYRKYAGHMLSADDAYRLNTQVKTLALRVRQQFINAARIAEILKVSPYIARVWYPGIKDHPSHNEAAELFRDKGFGGMVTFDFAGKNSAEKKEIRDRFIKTVRESIRIIPSLGDPRTMMLPVASVWGTKYPEPGMIRLSAGFEDTDEICNFINKGLSSLN
jgi:cystathionine beta-lyase/cystathionine gamma-synthase